jgi:hypothetical protein
MGEDFIYHNYIPTRYNVNTLLEDKVPPHLSNKFRFAPEALDPAPK